jgi:hypothetical protein
VVVWPSETHLLVLLGLRFVQQLLIPLQTLCSRPTDNGCYGPPLSGHELGKVEQLFVFSLKKPTLRRQRRLRLRTTSEGQTFDHSVFLMDGSSHSYQRALHCFGVLRTRSEEIRAL